ADLCRTPVSFLAARPPGARARVLPGHCHRHGLWVAKCQRIRGRVCGGGGRRRGRQWTGQCGDAKSTGRDDLSACRPGRGTTDPGRRWRGNQAAAIAARGHSALRRVGLTQTCKRKKALRMEVKNTDFHVCTMCARSMKNEEE